MSVPRTMVLSVSVAGLALAGAQLGASGAAAAPAAATPGVIVVTAHPTATPTERTPPLTVGKATPITVQVPSNGTATSGVLSVDVNALAAVNANDLTLTETTGGTTQNIPLTTPDGDATDAIGATGVLTSYLPASGGQTTTLSLTSSSATGVRGQLAIFVEFDATNSSGTDTGYEADNFDSPGFNVLQVPRATPNPVVERVGLFRSSSRSLYYATSDTNSGGSPVQAVSGRAGDTLLTGDVFGSSDSYVVDYRPSTSVFYIADQFEGSGSSVTAEHFEAIGFGKPGDIPLVGAFPDEDTADGSLDTIAVYRPSNQTFYIYGSKVTKGLHFGTKGDIPVVGNWTGTKDSEGDVGADSIGVFRPSTHSFYLLTLSGSTLTKVFGRAGDKPVVGDWSGNGTSLVGVDRGNEFYLATTNGTSSTTYAPFSFGSASDQPVAAYANTPTDLLDIAEAESADAAAVAKGTAARAVVRSPRTVSRRVGALVVR